MRLLGENILVISGLGRSPIKGLDQRFQQPDGTVPRVKRLLITERAGRWFIQLAADFHHEPRKPVQHLRQS
ncbi:MAG: hypothetical protein F6K03_13265, partial [Kamptonema sp. SIO4C4]|nr:hypothetical protein [Kamptonema sp. SIO4C4]